MRAIRNNSDKRVIKTKMAIRSAFKSLVAEKDITQITVKDISDRALINRKTFYMHYSSVADVLSEAESDMAEILKCKIADIDLVEDRFNPLAIFQRITETIDDESAPYNRIIHSSASDSLTETMKSVLKDKLLDAISDRLKTSKSQMDCAVEFISSGMTSAYHQWLIGGRSEPLDEIARTVGEVASGGMEPLIDQRR